MNKTKSSRRNSKITAKFNNTGNNTDDRHGIIDAGLDSVKIRRHFNVIPDEATPSS